MPAKAKAQIQMEDHFIENPALEEVLEEREALIPNLKKYRRLDSQAKSAIIALNLEGERRCGRFIISAKAMEGRTVDSFERKGGVRVNIKAASDGASASQPD